MTDSKPSTLFGGRRVLATFTDGRAEDLHVRQLPLAEYERAWTVRDDEFALTALCCVPVPVAADVNPQSAKPCATEWIQTLQPDSYERLRAAAEEVNANGFFAWSARRAKREREALAAQLELASQMPPEALKLAIEAGQKSTSPTPSPAPSRRLV